MQRATPALLWASFVILVGALLWLGRSLSMGRAIAPVMVWIEGLGWWGPIAFSVLYVAATLFFIPVIVLTFTAGALFGVWVGALSVSLATTTSAALTFLIARYVARERVARWLRKKPRLHAVARAVEQGGWRILVLFRLSTVLPFSVQNGLYGLSAIGFWPYLLTSWVAMLPGIVLYVYLGHVTGAVIGGARDRTAIEWTMLGVGLIATVIAGLYITLQARRKLREYPQAR